MTGPAAACDGASRASRPRRAAGGDVQHPPGPRPRRARQPPAHCRGVRELDADVVGVQEIYEAQAEQLARRARACSSSPGVTVHRSDGAYGNAILTRLRLRGVATFDLSVGRREARGGIRVDLGFGGRPPHLQRPPRPQAARARRAGEVARRAPHPVGRPDGPANRDRGSERVVPGSRWPGAQARVLESAAPPDPSGAPAALGPGSHLLGPRRPGRVPAGPSEPPLARRLRPPAARSQSSDSTRVLVGLIRAQASSALRVILSPRRHPVGAPGGTARIPVILLRNRRPRWS